MSRPDRQTHPDEETESFEAFDLVTDALELIDSYDRSAHNEGVLREADERLSEALKKENDPGYLKAQYFSAMVSYLQNEPGEAIRRFQQMRKVDDDSPLGMERRYNLAAAYSAAGEWEKAVETFDGVVSSAKDNPELRLLARAGLMLTCSGGVEGAKRRLGILRGQKGAEAVASRRRNGKRSRDYLGKMQKEYESVRRELGQRDAGKAIDRRVREEVEQIVREAVGNRRIKLPPAAPPKKRWRISPAQRRIIIWVVISLIALLLAAALAHLFVVGDSVWPQSPGR